MCDRCFDVLKPAELQNALAGFFSKAAQQPVHDVTDWTSMRSWLNNPFLASMETDIFKCTNILRCDPLPVYCLLSAAARVCTCVVEASLPKPSGDRLFCRPPPGIDMQGEALRAVGQSFDARKPAL